ncbi:hypothetical protein PAMC26577_36840 [Caballeronia sordidicola]|uniref:Uncharacterized protein n=1 Tax=Caballeronia sordidicola TaxID=196367 RepID=A0A242M7X3_CABSO|nr:hypothetical protein PAMC26577_36840 [Caballeronia sordidicola]
MIGKKIPTKLVKHLALGFKSMKLAVFILDVYSDRNGKRAKIGSNIDNDRAVYIL